MALAGELQNRFGDTGEAEEFRVFDDRDRHRDWKPKATAAIQRLAAAWKTVGLDFPVTEVLEAW